MRRLKLFRGYRGPLTGFVYLPEGERDVEPALAAVLVPDFAEDITPAPKPKRAAKRKRNAEDSDEQAE